MVALIPDHNNFLILKNQIIVDNAVFLSYSFSDINEYYACHLLNISWFRSNIIT